MQKGGGTNVGEISGGKDPVEEKSEKGVSNPPKRHCTLQSGNSFETQPISVGVSISDSIKRWEEELGGLSEPVEQKSNQMDRTGPEAIPLPSLGLAQRSDGRLEAELDSPIKSELYKEPSPGERESGFKISVLLIDGWDDAKKVDKQAMTLIVLKFVLDSNDRNQRFKSTEITLQFEDNPNNDEADGKVGSEVVAWTPPCIMWRSDDRPEAGVAWEKGNSFKESSFNEGHVIMNKIDGRRNGMRWYLKQNDIKDHDTLPELHVAMLIKRASGQPYTAKLEVQSRAGTIRDFKMGIKRFFKWISDEH